MEELLLWALITVTLAGCAAAMCISYNVALRRRKRLAEDGCDLGTGGSWLELQQLVMGLVLVLPFLIVASIVPSANARSILNFTFCWVTPCKLLLLFYTNFFLDSPSAWTFSHFSHFLLTFLLPIRIKGMRPPGLNASKLSFFNKHLCSLIIRFSILLSYLSFYDSMPSPLTHISHCVGLYLILDLPHRIASIGLLLIFGIECHPTFHSPWLSSSPTDFWGCRWDLTANALLRHTVYNPIINMLTMPSTIRVAIKGYSKEYTHATATTEIDFKLRLRLAPLAVAAASGKTSSMSCVYGIVGSESHHKLGNEMSSKKKSLKGQTEASWSSITSTMLWAPTKPPTLAVRLVGVNTTFCVSGLIHELLYFCVTQGEMPTWEVTAFFIVQGMAASMEILLRRTEYNICKRLPRPLKVALTMAFMHTTATWLFFPQLVKHGVYAKCARELKTLTQAVGSNLTHVA